MSSKNYATPPFYHAPNPSPYGRLQAFYEKIFKEMEGAIEKHQTFGNWAVGGIPHLSPLATQKALGLWYAQGNIPGIPIPGAMSIALLPGDTRVGLFLPDEALQSRQGESWLEDRVALAYDGNHPRKIREANRMLFDRTFHEAPFDAQTLKAALSDPEGPEFLLIFQRLAYMVTTIWVTAIRVLYADGRVRSEEFVVQCQSPLSPEDLSGLPSGMLIQTHAMENGLFFSYVRAMATAEQIAAHLRARGLPDLVVEPIIEGGVC